MKENIAKENFIKVTYSILETEGIKSISIRRIARELECNTANLYRYFKNLDELILYSSLKYLSDYINELKQLDLHDISSMELHYQVWECFAKHSFKNPEIFNLLFFGKCSSKLESIIEDYYRMFPNDMIGIDKDLKKALSSGDFQERDYHMLCRCEENGFIEKKDLKIVNIFSTQLYKGFLKDILDNNYNQYSIEDMKDLFIKCLRDVISKYEIK